MNGFRALLRVVLLEHLPLIVALGIHAGAVLYFIPEKGAYPALWSWQYATLMAASLWCVATLRIARIAVEEARRERLSLAAVLRRTRMEFLTLRMLAGGGVVLALYAPFVSGFMLLKAEISRRSHFSWEQPLEHLDRVLHGGTHPWYWLQPALGSQLVSMVLDHAYWIWFVVMFVVLWGITFCSNRTHRLRFLLAFFLSWVLIGNLAASLMPSAGPAFYRSVTGDSATFAPMHAYFEGMREPPNSTTLQKTMWEEYQSGERSHRGGIAAMPSMHVAVAILLPLGVRALIPWMAGPLWGFAVLITLATIHLGWHYAVDAYAAVALTLFIWSFSGWFVRIYARRFPLD